MKLVSKSVFNQPSSLNRFFLILFRTLLLKSVQTDYIIIIKNIFHRKKAFESTNKT